MALDIRKTRYDTADVLRMLKDVQNYDDIPQTVWKRIADSSGAMNAIAASSTAMNAVAASSTAMDTVAGSSTAMNAVAASSTAMDIIAASSTAMNTVAGSSTAMNAIMSGTQVETWWNSSYYVGKGLATYASLSHTDLDSLNTVNDIVNSSTAMNDIWGSDSARQALWSSATARLALYNNSAQLKALTVNSTPDLIDETPLNTDYNAGYLSYTELREGKTNWTAVNINDGGKYLVWIHFHSYKDDDWYSGKIASYDQSTDLQETDGGQDLTRGNFNTTSNGLWVYFIDNFNAAYSLNSFARVWYIKV